jgi:Ca2+-binding EF-hand superfamily protein
VLVTASRAEEILIEIRDALAIDGEQVYAQIDELGLGFVTLRTFQAWVANTLGFKLNDLESELVLGRYDKDGDYRIKREEFLSEVAQVNSPQEEEEEAIREALQENNND